MTANKRSKVDIYSAVLESICSEGGKMDKASPTRVAHRANLPYDRFQKIIDQFVQSELISRSDDGLQITLKGLKCLDQIHKSNEFLRRMGLTV